MDAYRAIVDKRDQRIFLPEPISEDALRRILQAARMTGSSKNAEPNRLIVVRDRARVAAVGAVSPLGTVAVHGRRRHRDRADGAPRVRRRPLCSEHDARRLERRHRLLPRHLPEADLARLLEIPNDMVINRVIGFGYVDPQRAAPPKSVARRRKPLDDLVRDERWSEPGRVAA